MLWQILLLLALPLAAVGDHDARRLLGQADAVVDLFWESYLEFPNSHETCLEQAKSNTNSPRRSRRHSFAFSLAEINGARESNGTVVTSVSIAFASSDYDYCNRRFVCRELVCGLHLFEGLDEDAFEAVRREIAGLRRRGVVVKLAFGGAEHGNLRVNIKTTQVAELTVDVIVDAVRQLGVDGVDLVQKEGCGSRNLDCDDLTSVHLFVVEQLRRRMPDKVIGYTFPTGSYGLNYPFVDVVKYGGHNLDTVTLFGTSHNVQEMVDDIGGLPVEKILVGFPIGCDQKPFSNVSLSDALSLTRSARRAGMKGVSVWSFHRDTDARSGSGCNAFQTGAPKGTFVNAIYNELGA